MPECGTPLWPCAMTGAAACLAGFEGITVVIHGSSGCYYYPATLLHAPLHRYIHPRKRGDFRVR